MMMAVRVQLLVVLACSFIIVDAFELDPSRDPVLQKLEAAASYRNHESLHLTRPLTTKVCVCSFIYCL